MLEGPPFHSFLDLEGLSTSGLVLTPVVTIDPGSDPEEAAGEVPNWNPPVGVLSEPLDDPNWNPPVGLLSEPLDDPNWNPPVGLLSELLDDPNWNPPVGLLSEPLDDPN